MLSQTSRTALFLVAALYAVLGIILFVAPTWAAANFAWNVSPMVAMTIGGWCLGNAWAAFGAARRWRLSLILSVLTYLTLFGLLESGVALAFADKLRLGHWLGWLYVAALGANALAAIVWLVDWLVRRPTIGNAGDKFRPSGLIFGIPFIAFVGFLGLYGLLAPAGSRGLGGGIFPQVVSMFTLRAFGAFYLAIALAPVALLVTRSLEMTLSHILLSWGTIIFVTLAALIFIGEFDFASRPGQSLYLVAYGLVAIVTAIYMVKFGTGRSEV